MNKTELINQVSDSTGLTKSQTTKALDSFMESIKTTLQNGEKVILVGFGTFKTSDRKSRKGRNPQTGEELVIPAKRVPKFKPGKKLSNQVNS